MLVLMFLKKPSLRTRLLASQYSDILIRCQDMYYFADPLSGVSRFHVTSCDLDNWDCVYMPLPPKQLRRVKDYLDLNCRYMHCFSVRLMCRLFPSVIRHLTPPELAREVLNLAGRPIHRDLDIDALYLALQP